MRETREVEIIWALWIEADALDSITPEPTDKFHAAIKTFGLASRAPLCGIADNWKYRTYEEGRKTPRLRDLCEKCRNILEANDE